MVPLNIAQLITLNLSQQTQQDHFMLDIQEAQYLVTLFQIYYHLMVTKLQKNTM